MASNSDIRYRQTLDNSQFKKGLKESQSLTQQIGNSIKSIGPMIAGAFAVGAVASFFKTSLQGMFEEEKASAQLLNSLKGRRDLTDTLIAQAKNLSQITLFEDKDIIAGQSILAVFVKQKEQLTALTPLVADFATKFGMDLEQAAKMVGKSVAGSAVAMKKLGIEVTGTAGSTERYNSVLDALTEKVGGAAVDAANTNAGSVQNLGKAWGEFGETLVQAVGPSLAGIAKGLTSVTSAADNFFSDRTMTAWQKFKMMFAGTVGDISAVSNIATDSIIKNVEDERNALGPSRAGFEEFLGNIDEINTANKEAAEAAAEAAKNFEKEQKELRAKDKAFAQNITKSNKPITLDVLLNANPASISDFQKKVLDAFSQVANTRITGFQLPTEDFKELDLAMRTTADGMTTFTDKYEKMWVDVQAISEGIQQAFQAVVMSTVDAFSDMITAAVSGEGGFKQIGAGLLGSIGQIMSDLGKQFIIIGGLGEVFAKAVESMQWYVALGAGVALVAAGAVLKGIAKKSAQPQGMAEGGIVPAGFPGDTYPARLTSGEMVIPPHKLDSMINTQQVVVLETKLKGQDIWLAQKKVNTKMDNYR